MPDRFYVTTAIAYANNAPGLHTVYEVIGADVIARWHRMMRRRDPVRHRHRRAQRQHRPVGGRAGDRAACLRRPEGGAVPRGRGRPADPSRPVHPDDRPGPLPVRPGDGPPGVRQRRHLSRDVRGLVLPQRGLQGAVRPVRDRDRDAVPQPPRRAAPVALGAQLVLPPLGLPGAPAGPLRGEPRLRPAGVPAQRDARLHPPGPRGLLDQPRRRDVGHPVPDRRERRDRAARGRVVGSRGGRDLRLVRRADQLHHRRGLPRRPGRRSTAGGRRTCT